MNTTATPPVVQPQRPGAKTPGWAKFLLVLFVLVLIGAASFGGIAIGKMLGADEERSVQVVRSVKGEEQVILVTAGIGDTEPRSDNQSFFGLFDVPFSDREVFFQYGAGSVINSTVAFALTAATGEGWMRLCEQVHTGEIDVTRIQEAWGDYAPGFVDVVRRMAGQRSGS